MSVLQRELDPAQVASAATGDEVAFARIVAAYHDDMARICFVICRDTALAQEAAHAAWPIAWRKLGTVRDPGKLRPWLLAIAANEARQLARRRAHRALREIAADPGTTTRWCPGRPTPPIGSLRSTSRTRWPGSIPPTGRSSVSVPPDSHLARSGGPSA